VAGRKVFTSGEILTAADVNSFLMDQSVMVFADSSARSSAIPSPTEGMVTFREDQDVVEVYDGSAFKTVGGLVAVKSALKTDTFTASVGASGNVAVTDLSITHALSDASNKLIITAFFGAAATTGSKGQVGIAVDNGSGLLALGDASGSRSQVTAGGLISAQNASFVTTMPSVTFVHSPNTTTSLTYTVHAINITSGTFTLYVNRNEDDTDNSGRARAASSLVIQEVAV